MIRPDIPRPGDPIRARDIAWLMRQVYARIRGGKGIRVTQYSEGDIIIAHTRKGGGGGFTHPFKVTPNGDEFVTVGDGELVYFTSSDPSNQPALPLVADNESFVAEQVEVTASGTIFLVIPTDELLTYTDSQGQSYVFGGLTSALTVALDPIFSGPNIYLPIADVQLADGIASVTKQILTHNPIIQVGYAVSAIQS